MRHLAELVGFKGDFPNRHAVARNLDDVYIFALGEMTAKLRRAKSFCVVFDLWTSRRFKNSFVACVHRWIDESNGTLKEALLDLVWLGDKAHTAHNVALMLAERIDERTTSEQFFGGAATDNARNVVKAARTIVHQLEQVLAGARPVAAQQAAEVAVGNQQAADVLQFEAAVNAFEEIEARVGGDGDDDNAYEELPEIDQARTQTCVIHSVQLAILNTNQSDNVNLTELVHKADVITVAIARSTKLQNILAEYQRFHEGNEKKALVRRNPTRSATKLKALSRTARRCRQWRSTAALTRVQCKWKRSMMMSWTK